MSTYTFPSDRQFIEIDLPVRFYDDHVARDLPSGEVWRRNSRYVHVALNKLAFNDLLDDARHYADPGIASELDPEYRGLVSSAKATVKRLERYIEAGVVTEIQERKARIAYGRPQDSNGFIQLRNRVAQYLPSNYRIEVAGNELFVVGHDAAGWTLDGYVIPRLASGLIVAEEVSTAVPDEPSGLEILR